MDDFRKAGSLFLLLIFIIAGISEYSETILGWLMNAQGSSIPGPQMETAASSPYLLPIMGVSAILFLVIVCVDR